MPGWRRACDWQYQHTTPLLHCKVHLGYAISAAGAVAYLVIKYRPVSTTPARPLQLTLSSRRCYCFRYLWARHAVRLEGWWCRAGLLLFCGDLQSGLALAPHCQCTRESQVSPHQAAAATIGKEEGWSGLQVHAQLLPQPPTQ